MKLRSAMSIPPAAAALEESLRTHRPRSQPKAYEKAMSVALTSISRATSAGLTSTVMNVPTFVFGTPRFDVDDVTEHVKANLEPLGYRVATYPGSPSIAISWGKWARAPGEASPPTCTAWHASTEACADYDIGL